MALDDPMRSKRPTRVATTWLAVAFLSLGAVFGLLGLFNLAAVSSVAPEQVVSGLTRRQVALEAMLSLASNAALIAAGVALLLRANSAARLLVLGLTLEMADSLYKYMVTIPPQIEALGDPGGSAAYYLGALTRTAVLAGLYLFSLVYLRSERSRREFGPSGYGPASMDGKEEALPSEPWTRDSIPRQAQQSRLGIASLILSVIGISSLGAVARGASPLLGLLAVHSVLIGFALGLAGVVQQKRARRVSALGLTFNSALGVLMLVPLVITGIGTTADDLAWISHRNRKKGCSSCYKWLG